MSHTHLGRLLQCILLCCAGVFVSGCHSVAGQSEPRAEVDVEAAPLGAAFTSGFADVNGTRLYYVRGGDGPSVLLLHGFPEDWTAYRSIMPRLAERFSVVAVDLRGIGRSTATAAGYDAETQADDMHALLEALGIDNVHATGHDVGGAVAYAFARKYPAAVRGVLILESPLPGIEPWAELKADPTLWHFGFHQTPSLPEKLLAGREYTYLREGFLTSAAISDGAVARYAYAYRSPDHLRAGLEYYRAFPASEAFLDHQRTPLDTPIVVAGGDQAFGPISEQIANGIRTRGAANTRIESIPNAAHYVIDEQPDRIAELIEQYAAE